MPKKTFVAGTVLLAADVNEYLSTSRNVILNSDFSINQRVFSSTTSSGTYGFDRWYIVTSGGTSTYSTQAFTPGAAPVAGYEARNFARIVTTSQSGSGDFSLLAQQIEDVRTLAGETAVVSFWAKAASGTPSISVEVGQLFGSGGSPSTEVNTFVGKVAISTVWTRYSVSVAVPSITGKTIGTTANTSSLRLNMFVSAGTSLNARTGSLGVQNNTFDIWGVQFEEGSVATPFSRATPTIQSELAACQRYYYRKIAEVSNGVFGIGFSNGTTSSNIFIPFPVKMRTTPSSTLDWSTTASNYRLVGSGQVANVSSTIVIDAGRTTSDNAYISAPVASITAGIPVVLEANTSATAFLGFSAEF